jgi:hypothetical protein
MRIEKKNRERETETLYYHDMAAATIVKPGKPVVVLPLVPEFIRNEDGKEKQDCERNAAKRWINRHKEKDESHPWIAEQVRYAEPERYERREWNHRNHLSVCCALRIRPKKIGFQPIFYPANCIRTEGPRSPIIGDFLRHQAQKSASTTGC